MDQAAPDRVKRVARDLASASAPGFSSSRKGDSPMTVALASPALLGLLVFGPAPAASALRGSTGTNIGPQLDPSDRLHKMVRAHGNAAEYAPMLAVLMLAIATRGATRWMVWTFVAATLFRYLHAAGMLLSPTLDRPQPLRFVGALGTYLSGLLLVGALLLVV